jgi:methylamine dehydrogenase heavy chain
MKVHPAKAALLSAAAALLVGAAAASAQTPPAAKPPIVPSAEQSDVATLGSAMPRWVFVTGGGGQDGTRIFDGDSGKMQGLIQTFSSANVALDPQGRFYYVAETMWTKMNRGTRQDQVSIYDSHSLNLLSEIAIPGRLIVGSRKQNFILSRDGKLGFIYNMQPSSSVVVVDLEHRKYQQTIELPGCASLFADPAGGFSALCSDGSLATVSFSGAKATVAHSAPFFSASQDPIYDNGVVNPATGAVTFVTYTGKIYSAVLGAQPKIEAPWSVQEAAGLRAGTTGPLNVNWLPGGRQLLAVHQKSGRIYLLMHVGEFWSSKEAGEEIWVLDGATHKLIGRHKTPGKVTNIEVSQDANPLVFLSGREGKTWVLEGDTFKEKHSIERSGGGNLYVIGPN